MLPGKRLKTIFGDQPRYTKMNFSPSDMPQIIESVLFDFGKGF